MGLLEIASATLRSGERRVDIAAQNAVNTETPGYKSQIAFSAIETDIPSNQSIQNLPSIKVNQNASQGSLFDTGEPLDLAINGSGYFLVRQGSEYHFTRGGNFGISGEGAIIDSQGRVLQLASGGDAQTSNFQIEIRTDGTILDDGVPVGTIGLFQPPAGSVAEPVLAEDVTSLNLDEASQINQAMLERSNAVLSDEMVELMRAQRQIESGAQLVRAYDQLMDRAISTFGRGAQ